MNKIPNETPPQTNVKLIQLLLYMNKCILCYNLRGNNNTSLSPPPHNAQTQALARHLVQLHSERVPQVLLLVLGLVPVDHQPNPVRCLPQHVDGFIMTGCAQVDTVHLFCYERELLPLCAPAILGCCNQKNNWFKIPFKFKCLSTFSFWGVQQIHIRLYLEIGSSRGL